VEIPVRILDQYRNPTYAILRLTDIKANNLNQSSVDGTDQEEDVSIVIATGTRHCLMLNVCALYIPWSNGRAV